MPLSFCSAPFQEAGSPIHLTQKGGIAAPPVIRPFPRSHAHAVPRSSTQFHAFRALAQEVDQRLHVALRPCRPDVRGASSGAGRGKQGLDTWVPGKSPNTFLVLPCFFTLGRAENKGNHAKLTSVQKLMRRAEAGRSFLGGRTPARNLRLVVFFQEPLVTTRW